MNAAKILNGFYLLPNGTFSRFKVSEFCCRCGCGNTDIDEDLVAGLTSLFYCTAIDFVVNCSCRCKKHNADVGGSFKSLHLSGNGKIASAADIQCITDKTLDSTQALYFVSTGFFNGVGLYAGKVYPYLHVDTRQSPAFWYKGLKYNYFTEKVECWEKFETYFNGR